MDLAEVLQLAGRAEAASPIVEEAIRLQELKGSLVESNRARSTRGAAGLGRSSRRRIDLFAARTALIQRAERLEHGPRVATVPFRRQGQRLVEGAPAVRARQRERGQELSGLAAGEQAQQLDNRRRALDLA